MCNQYYKFDDMRHSSNSATPCSRLLLQVRPATSHGRSSFLPWLAVKPTAASMAISGKDILKIIACIILPPLGVGLHVGLTMHFFLNIVLTILGYIPGIIHALFVIATMPEH
jgi:uncharacterized membrane protein YqaE (UPF0057 family)